MADKGTRTTTHSRDAQKVDERKRRAEPDQGHAGDLADALSVFDRLLAEPGMELPVEKHAAVLGDARFAHPANASQKARMVGRLQNDYGNAHVQRVVQSIAVQPKPIVSPPDDQYEREAARVADVATKPAEPHLQRRVDEGEEDTLATKALGTAPEPALQRQKEEAAAHAPTVTVARREAPGTEVPDLSPAAAVLQRQAAPGAVGPGPAALKIKRAFAVERRTKGLKLGPVVLGKTIKGEVSVEGTLKAGGGAGPEAEVTISPGAENKAALELKKEITKGLEFKGGVEIGDDSQKIGSGLDLQLYSAGGTTYKAVLDATIWERQGSDITFLAVDVGVSGSTKTVIPLPRAGFTFEGELGLKVTASVEPHWPTISRLAARVGARFVGPAASAAAQFGAAALPYLAVAAIAVAYIAAIGGGLYMVAEAHRTGRRLGMRRTFAYGYAAVLADLIRAGKGATPEMTRTEALALLSIDPKAYFEQAMKWRSEGYLIAALDRAEMAGKAAAAQYLHELIKAHGLDAWKEWCRHRKPNEYRGTLRAQAESERDVPIGITIDLKKAPSGAAAKVARSPLQRQTEEGQEDEGALATRGLGTAFQSTVQRHTKEGEEDEARQTKPAGAKALEASDSLESRINAARDGGRPLADPVRAELEPRLGREFGHVRIHTDAEAGKLSRELNAKAFTTGRDVFFRSGDYQPGSIEGKRLLAHELAHVAQQDQPPASGSPGGIARQASAEVGEPTVVTAARPPGYEDVTSPAGALGKEAAHQILIPIWNNAELVEQAKKKDAYLRGYSDDLGPEVQSAIATTLLLMFAEMDKRVKALPLKFGPDGLILPPEGVRWKSAEFAGIVEGIDPFHMADPFWQTYSRKAPAGKRPTGRPGRGPSTTRHTFEEGETVTGELPSWATGGAPPPGSESARPGKEIGPAPEPKLPKGVPIKPRISLNPLQSPPITIAWDLLKNWIGAREEGVVISARDISIEVTAACIATMASQIPYQPNPPIPPPTYDFIKPILDQRLKEAGGKKNLSAAQAHARGRRMGTTFAKRFIDDLQKSKLNTGWGEAPVEKGGAVYLWWLKYKYKERARIYGYVLTLLPKPSAVSVKERYRKKRGR